jgi:hypothetical protein
MSLILKLDDATSKKLIGFDYKGSEYWIPEIGNVTKDEFEIHLEKEYKKTVLEKFTRFILNEFVDPNATYERINNQIKKIISIICENDLKITVSNKKE